MLERNNVRRTSFVVEGRSGGSELTASRTVSTDLLRAFFNDLQKQAKCRRCGRREEVSLLSSGRRSTREKLTETS
jgi:hypothetical protein